MSLRIPCLVPVALAASITAPLLAQLPAHHAVVGTASYPGVSSFGTTGVFFVPLPTPAAPGPFTPIPVTGLPPTVTVAAGPSLYGGTLSVLHNPSDGKLFVSDAVWNPGTVQLHLLTLTGSAVTGTTSLQVGTPLPGWGHGTGRMSLLPDGRVLVPMGDPSKWVPNSGPAAFSPLGILDTSGPTPVLTPMNLQTPLLGFAGTSAVSPDGSTAYVTTSFPNVSPPCHLYKIDIPTQGSPVPASVTPLYTWSQELAFDVTLHPDGVLYVVGVNPATAVSTLYLVDTNVSPVVVIPLPFSPTNVALPGTAMEPATGLLVHTSVDWPGTVGGVFANSIVTSGKHGGVLTPLASQPGSGWGMPFAIDINSSFQRYGVDTPAANSYRIVDCPNPGGLPQIGNSNFSITVRVVGGSSSASWMMIGFSPDPAGSLILGVSSFVQPPWIVLPMTTGSQAQLALPVPNNATLLGAVLYAQGVHIDPGGLATSDAVRIEIMQ